jgi:exodeoxyribonuclease VII small subunit
MPRAAPTSVSASTPDDPVVKPPLSYEEALSELERLVGAMEGSALPLDRLLSSYQRAAELLNHCRDRLSAVEQQVKVLEDGQLKAWMPGTTPTDA